MSIEDVYSRAEAEEQRRLVITGRKGDHISYNERSVIVSHASVGAAQPSRKCTRCKKIGHTMEFCWDLHPEKKNSRGRSSSGKKPISDITSSSAGKVFISVEEIHELRAYLSRIDVGQAEASDVKKVNHALVISREKGCILGSYRQGFMHNSPTNGSVYTTVTEKQILARASLAFNCKSPMFRKMFLEYVEQYNQLQNAEKLNSDRLAEKEQPHSASATEGKEKETDGVLDKRNQRN
ncbi:Ubiquitin-conjugating enzyme E2 34 [Nymphaea thermarum]|nr:Ubiquitin-conjugating enzyme E2 34 [Nymphaea thermarum]